MHGGPGWLGHPSTVVAVPVSGNVERARRGNVQVLKPREGGKRDDLSLGTHLELIRARPDTDGDVVAAECILVLARDVRSDGRAVRRRAAPRSHGAIECLGVRDLTRIGRSAVYYLKPITAIENVVPV